MLCKKVLKILCFIFAFFTVHAYINNEEPYLYKSSKSSYLNYEINRFKNKLSTTTTTTTEKAFKNRSYHSLSSSYNHRINRNNHPYYNNRQHYDQNSDHRIRHTHNSRFTKMDQLLSRISNTNLLTTTTIPITTKNSGKKLYTSTETIKNNNNTNSNDNKKMMYHARFSTTQKPEDYDLTDDEENNNKNTDSLNEKTIIKKTILDDDEEAQDTLDDDDNNDETTDEDNDEVDDDDDDDDEEEDDDDNSDDWQAEEATEEPTERTLTEYKWKHFGTRSRVEESRRNAGITNNNLRQEVYQAVEHARRINLQGSCKIPRIRLVKVQNVYPDAGKAYIPHCTLLHRCSDDTGCCRSETLTCAPKKTEKIELHFYTGRPGSYRVEKLAFYNHTECHCIERTQEIMSQDAAQDEHISDDKYPFRPAIEARTVKTEVQPQTIAEPIRRCQCPDLYTPYFTHGQCKCDCQDGHRDCMRIKRGKEYFSLKDRLCIQRQECGYPACEFGVYIRFSGRCPRKQEKLEALSRISPQ